MRYVSQPFEGRRASGLCGCVSGRSHSNSNLMDELKKVYNKEFSSGFYLGLPTSDDFAKQEHNASKEKKHFIGKILHYYPRIKVATIKLSSAINIGEKFCVIGNKTGIENFEIKEMQIKHKSVESAKKYDEIGIKLNKLVRKNDEVYKIIKN